MGVLSFVAPPPGRRAVWNENTSYPICRTQIHAWGRLRNGRAPPRAARSSRPAPAPPDSQSATRPVRLRSRAASSARGSASPARSASAGASPGSSIRPRPRSRSTASRGGRGRRARRPRGRPSGIRRPTARPSSHASAGVRSTSASLDHPLDEAPRALAPDQAAELARDLVQRVGVAAAPRRRRRRRCPRSSCAAGAPRASRRAGRRRRPRRAAIRKTVESESVNELHVAVVERRRQRLRAGPGSTWPDVEARVAPASRRAARRRARAASRLAKIAPRIAVPSEPPIERNRVAAEVATPSCA